MPGVPGHSPDIALPFDPTLARQLLAEAGYADGKGFPALELRWPFQSDTLDYLKTQWQKILNIEVKLERAEWAEVLEWFKTAQIHYIGFGEDAGPGAVMAGLRFISPNWQNDAFHKLLEKARRTYDKEASISLYQKADSILIEQAVVLPITYERQHHLLKPWVKIPARGTGSWSMKDVIIEPH